MKRLVVLTGNLGTGKTTLAKRLSERFSWWIGCESVSDNPYLNDFYADPRLWAFHLQVYFLGHRARTYQEAAARPEGAVIDGSIDADRNVFANSLHRQGSLSIRDLTCYDSVHRLVTAELPTPHLIIHVRAPASVLRARIQQRGQAFDRNLPLSYLAEIDEMFSSWMDTVTAAPVLTVDSSTVDFTAPHQDVGLQTLFGTVERMLQ